MPYRADLSHRPAFRARDVKRITPEPKPASHICG